MTEQAPEPITFKEINRHAPEIMQGLENAPIFKKQGEMRAEIAKGGEEIITKLTDGTTETKNVAKAGDAIITNPGGERYVIDGIKFAKRYEPKAGEPGVYSAKGYCKAIDNPFNSPVTMMASWGEMQNGAADCLIADTYDIDTKAMGGEPYIIARAEFNQTYKLAE
ncbi:MAG: PGDYG domain-containing protein [Candidatus Pacebacteria bacterium]|nr:PGDYG domain-containing protein [Candidatus Paceibacterota bacterium]MDD5357262.1 PGDYG domain-containing protein [Candidatus Paceibacterota bacterium]